MIIFSDAGKDMLWVFGVLAAVGVWGVVWLVRVIVYCVRNREKRKTIQHPLIYFAIEPLLFIAVLALAFGGVFSSARFAISESYLTRYAEDLRVGKIQASRNFNEPSQWIGLYRVSRIDLLEDGTVRFLTSRHGLLDSAGYVYSDAIPPPKQGEDFYAPMHSKWWRWHESW